MLRGILFVIGFAVAVIGVGVLVAAYVARNPYSESDAQPFSKALTLDGRETRIAFTATTSENYELHVTIHLPAEAKEQWVRYSCLMGAAPTYYSCDETGHLKIVWIIRDLTDSAWHDWTVNSKTAFENVDGVGSGKIGWFTPVRGHAYVIKVHAEADVPAIRQSPAVVYAYFGGEDVQGRVAFGNVSATLFLLLGIPATLVGTLLVVTCWPRRTKTEMGVSA